MGKREKGEKRKGKQRKISREIENRKSYVCNPTK